MVGGLSVRLLLLRLFIETRNKNRIISAPYLTDELNTIFEDGAVVDGEIVDKILYQKAKQTKILIVPLSGG